MRLHLLLLVVTITYFTYSVNSYKILGLFSHPGKSHVDIFIPLMKGLARKGHEVTVVSYFPLEHPEPRYIDISLRDPEKLRVGTANVKDVTLHSLTDYLFSVKELHELQIEACEFGLKSQALQTLMSSNETFDLIVAEYFNSYCFLGFAYKFNVPIIALSSCTLMAWNGEVYAQPDNPSYIPTSMGMFADHMTFFERVGNTAVSMIHKMYFKWVIGPSDQEIADKYFGFKLPPLTEIAANSSLILVNTHFSFSKPKPNVPGVIEIGGIHLQETKPLPKNIEKWINESKEGVIYFSLGSIIKGHTFPEDKRQAFLKAFSRLPQRVLWKWENETMPGKPDNVMIQKWMPQFDILCNPNVKAFISHGGLLGTTEAVHCGVPIIVMPQFGDQFTNARAIEANGGGVILQLQEATEQKVYKALKTVLDPKFREGAKELSERFRDRPMSPLDTAIYWVEYVARHKGARHMRTAAVDMPLYQYLLLDVVAFLLSIFIGVILVIYFSIRALFRVLLGKNTKKVKTH